MIKKILFINFLTIFFLLTPTKYIRAEYHPEKIQALEKELAKLKERLNHLEPEFPQVIKEKPLPLPKITYPVKEIIVKENQISCKTILSKPNYERPIYELDWHSSIGRWSYIPNRIHYAHHRLFTNSDIGLSNWYDFEHNLGLDIPMNQTTPLNLYLVTFQTEVKHIYTKGNQIVIVGIPRRSGVEVNTITFDKIKPNNLAEPLLIQLVTPDGYEIDYTIEFYVDPDYWQKLKEKKQD